LQLCEILALEDPMNVPISFTKASGAGNDFVLVNNFTGGLRIDLARFASAVCDRHFGVGGDGLLVLGKSTRADFTMLYYNADGSSAVRAPRSRRGPPGGTSASRRWIISMTLKWGRGRSDSI
jgi:hypothetical protein